ncbi:MULTISPECIES: type I restriction-modification system subunit M [unclassified Meiothermus]|uniref:type I restriction-modification system subunit M n=1 Tax=unclassified Meiothermus TaxID=370471 RepID=UPI000D7D10D4|nr:MULTISPECIES: type I restriction-modification system subunit M [unclassified Meiothermus]PZA07241.1 type I restriction-modification system subunit M [Meiothermus sp. Pnk-1]RYM37975.1 type I restriction-modification system subunit M [Meiothermus sp. PNK-Is4]
MTEQDQIRLGKVLWAIADELRGAMNADDFRDYMLSFLFLRYLSDNYEEAARRELGDDWPKLPEGERRSPLAVWYEQNPDDIAMFEDQMRRKVHYVIKPEYLWSSIAEMARTQDAELLHTLQKGFKFIENESFASSFQGLFSEINLDSDKLGKNYPQRNARLCKIIQRINEGLAEFPRERDLLGDAYEYLIGQFAAGSGKKAGEFYTPQQISSILSGIVSLDAQDPKSGKRERLGRVLDFACGSGSLLLNVWRRMGRHGVGKLYGQEKNITTYNLARMNMLLHGLKDTEFEIFHGDSLLNEWPLLREENPAKKIEFDAVVANPPFSYRWDPSEELAEDFRFKDYGLAPKSAADFAFLLHGFHFLHREGTMAIILPHGVLFRGNAEAKIRRKLLKDGNIDTVIGLAPNLFYSTGIPVCILVLKKCKKFDDVLFINAAELYEKGKRQNRLLPEHIDKIVETYQYRREVREELPNGAIFASRRVSMEEIEENDFNLNITRYVSTAASDEEVDLKGVGDELRALTEKIAQATRKHNQFLIELGLPGLPEG